MRFTHNNATYEIDFEYSDGIETQYHRPRKGVTITIEREVRYTYAYVYEKVTVEHATGLDTIKVIVAGTSTCQPEDRFVKETGRTLALRDAVKNLQDQELKTKIFECYFNRPRGK